MHDTVTDEAVVFLLSRLATSYGKPFGVKVVDQAKEYAAAFRRNGLPMTAVQAAVDEAISLGKRFPPVSELIERARTHLPKTDGERQRTPAPEACTQCGSGHFYAGYDIAPQPHWDISGGVFPKLRCRCPDPDPAWYTDAALGWSEGDYTKHRDRLKPGDYESNHRYRVRMFGGRQDTGPSRAV